MTEGKKRREWKSQAKPTSVLRKHDTFSPRLRRKCSVMTRLDLPSSGWPLSLARSSLILTNYIPDWQKIGSCRSVGPGTLASLALEERERDRETRYTTLKMTNTFIKKAKEHWSEKIDCMLASQGGTCKLIRNKKCVVCAFQTIPGKQSGSISAWKGSKNNKHHGIVLFEGDTWFRSVLGPLWSHSSHF